jgi:hypothetical protein
MLNHWLVYKYVHFCESCEVVEDSVLLGYDCASLGEWISTFCGNVLFSSSSVKMSDKLKMRALHFLKMSGPNCPLTPFHIPEEGHLHVRSCSLKVTCFGLVISMYNST